MRLILHGVADWAETYTRVLDEETAAPPSISGWGAPKKCRARRDWVVTVESAFVKHDDGSVVPVEENEKKEKNSCH